MNDLGGTDAAVSSTYTSCTLFALSFALSLFVTIESRDFISPDFYSKLGIFRLLGVCKKVFAKSASSFPLERRVEAPGSLDSCFKAEIGRVTPTEKALELLSLVGEPVFRGLGVIALDRTL